MVDLVPEVEPTLQDDFGQFGDTLKWGMLYYDEDLGTVESKVKVELDEETMLVKSGLIKASCSMERTDKLRQRTWVRVFPDFEHTVDAILGINKYSITKRKLGSAAIGHHGLFRQGAQLPAGIPSLTILKPGESEPAH